MYAYSDTKERFLQSLALPRASQNPYRRREMIVSTNNAIMAYMRERAGTLPAFAVLHPGQLIIRSFRHLLF